MDLNIFHMCSAYLQNVMLKGHFQFIFLSGFFSSFCSEISSHKAQLCIIIHSYE